MHIRKYDVDDRCKYITLIRHLEQWKGIKRKMILYHKIGINLDGINRHFITVNKR